MASGSHGGSILHVLGPKALGIGVPGLTSLAHLKRLNGLVKLILSSSWWTTNNAIESKRMMNLTNWPMNQISELLYSLDWRPTLTKDEPRISAVLCESVGDSLRCQKRNLGRLQAIVEMAKQEEGKMELWLPSIPRMRGLWWPPSLCHTSFF